VTATELEQHMLTRVTSSHLGAVLGPSFHVSPDGFGQLINFQRWLAALFGASHFINADHILRSLCWAGRSRGVRGQAAGPGEVLPALFARNRNWRWTWKCCGRNKPLAAALFLALMSPRFLGTPARTPSAKPCSAGCRTGCWNWSRWKACRWRCCMTSTCIAATPTCRSAIASRAPSTSLEKKLRQEGLHDLHHAGDGRVDGKPVMLVLLEWFSGGHSIYRTHSKTLEAARRHSRRRHGL
jgi:hypothetical protein